ncbi:MAG: BON domain-containing protein [Pseudoxanthomonas sp.]
MAGDKEPVEASDYATQESAQPMSDTWITTKVQADLAAHKDMRGIDVKVKTVNGMVKLTGQAANQMQKNKAVEVTRSIKGVRSVDPDGLVTAATAKTR